MFKNIKGNNKNKEILKKAIEQNKLSHSYIFYGIEGIGKKAIAEELAKNILCIGSKDDTCKCKSCIEFETGNSIDYNLIDPEEGKIKIEEIRQMQRKIVEKPIISKKKVYVINNAETMTIEAQNCLLKTLEEPPEYATIILITSNENNLLSTIKSRCTRMQFKEIEKHEIQKYMAENYSEEIEEDMLEMAQGSIGKALKIKEDIEIYNNIKNILEYMKEKDIIEIVQMSEKIYSGKDQIKSILEYMNIILYKLGKMNINYIRCIKIIEETKKRIKANSNYDMCIDYMLFNIWGEINEKNNRS